MEVYKCGARVRLHLGNGGGMITASIIRFGSVRYEITKSDGEIVNKHEDEFIINSDKVKIGYKK